MKKLIICILLVSCNTTKTLVKLTTTSKTEVVEETFFEISYVLETFDNKVVGGNLKIPRKGRTNKQLMNILHNEIEKPYKKENIKIISFNIL